MKLDLAVRNVLVCDGTGRDVFRADVGVSGSIIAEISRRIPAGASENSFDGGGKLLCPGFIDSHGHSDISLLASPGAAGKISQGITTEISGNCGLSVFPISDRNRSHLEKLYRSYGVRIPWRSIEGYRKTLSRIRPAINIFPLCGYNTLRASVCGYRDCRMAESRFLLIERGLQRQMKGGAVGLSTGLIYVPGIFAGREELERIFSKFASFRKVWTTHLRSEGARLLESLEETFEVAARSGVKKVHISHLKTAGRENWGKIDAVFRMISEYSARGLEITADRYPYTESMTQLGSFLPAHFDKIDDVRLMRTLRDSAKSAELLRALDEGGDEKWLDRRMVCTNNCEFRGFSGDTFRKISEAKGMRPVEIVAELARTDASGTNVSSPGMSEDNMTRICLSDFVCCGTDESARPTDYSLGRSHPRGFGSMPKFFRIVGGRLGICEAVRKMTSLPARIFGLRKRGEIRKGFYADMVLIDPDKFSSDADFANPHRPAEGVIAVWVGGRARMLGEN